MKKITIGKNKRYDEKLARIEELERINRELIEEIKYLESALHDRENMINALEYELNNNREW
jgi:hypothetical protein